MTLKRARGRPKLTTELSEVAAPSLVQIALAELGVERSKLPSGDTALRGALLGETMRLGLYTLVRAAAAPVHELSLRSWLERKLGALYSGSEVPEEEDYRQVLLGGRGQSLELVGDALILTRGMVYPSPTRIITVGERASLLLSGTPSRLLGELRPFIAYTSLGRRLEGIDHETLKGMGLKTQSVESYLGVTENVPTSERLRAIAAGEPDSAWFGGDAWEVYIGNQGEGSGRPIPTYGFLWGRASGRVATHPLEVDVAGSRITLWREPVTSRYFRFWIKLVSPRGQFAINLPLADWKLTAIAMDSEARRSRTATIVRNAGDNAVILSVGFPPYWRLYRLIHLLGGELVGRRVGRDIWKLPMSGGPILKDLLTADGVRVEIKG
jgi:hypothetical protein